MKAYGPGLKGGLTEQPATFVVETNGAGQGGLGLAIEGWSVFLIVANCFVSSDY